MTELDSVRIIIHRVQIMEENLYLFYFIIFYLLNIYMQISPDITLAW
jgi:hypothetical protein